MFSFSKPLMKVVSVILCISLVLGCFSAFAEGKDPNKVTDDAPPELSNFVFPENGATLKAGDKVHLSVQAEDRSKIDSVSVEFQRYDGNDGDYFTVEMKYNATTDRFEGEYTLTPSMQNGLWYIVNVYTSDEYYNSYSMGGTDYGSFTLAGNLNPLDKFSDIKLTENGQTVKPGDTIHCAIKMTGEVNSVFAYVTSETKGDDSYYPWIHTQYNTETGWWEGEFTFTEEMVTDTYIISAVGFYTDKVDDDSWFTIYDDTFGRRYVTFTGGTAGADDNTGPVISGLTFTQNTATLGPKDTVNFTVTVSDPSGVESVSLYFEGPYTYTPTDENADWRKNHTFSRSGGRVTFELENKGGNTWVSNDELPESLVNTTFTLLSISACDKAGNWTDIDYQEGQYYFNFAGEDIVNENIGNFVKRCYNTILGRGVDETGLHDWGILLATGEKTGAEIINSLTESDEFKQKGLSNGEIVDRMYLAMLGREADAAGKAAWVSVLDEGYPVSAVVNGFSKSVEFRGICKGYGITPGSVDPGQPTQPAVPAANMTKIKAFVTRCYSVILGRDPDPDGLNAWADALATGVRKASEIIDGFVNSPEFLNKNLSKEEQVDILYKAMLGRGADPDGKAAWVQVLNDGNPFAAVINGFCGSIEFTNLCAEYGIQPGSVQVKAAFVKRVSITPEGSDPEDSAAYIAYSSEFVNQEKIRAFIMHCYETVLGREGDEEGIANYTALIMGGKKTPKRVAYEFIFSPEFQGRQPGNEELIQVLYKVYLYREADPEGLAAWVAQLDAGVGLEEIVKGFAESAEFKAIVREMKE